MSNQTNKAKEVLIKYSDVEAKRISFSDLEMNERAKQYIAYPRYDHPTLGADQRVYIQLPWIKIEQYGIPTANGKFELTENQRAKIKVPLNPEIADSKNLIDILDSMDNYFSSPDVAAKLLAPLGKKAKSYTFDKIHRESDNDDRLDYINLKLDTDYNDNSIKTTVFKSEIVDGETKRTEMFFKNVDELYKLVSYQSTIRAIVMMSKVWTSNATNKWGITFKIKKMEVKPSEKVGNGISAFMKSDSFLESDDEDAEVVKTKVAQPKQVAQVESDDDEEGEEVKIVAKKVATVAVESDDDDSEEEKPAKKAPTKSVRGGKGKSANA
jgi:hypothetical protein